MIMKFRKCSAVVFIIAASVLLLVASCSKKEGEGQNSSGAQISNDTRDIPDILKKIGNGKRFDNTTVHIFCDERIIRDDGRREVFDKFFQDNYGIHLIYTTPPASQRGEKLAAMMASGEVLDIIRETHAELLATYIDAGAIHDLTDLYNDSQVLTPEYYLGVDYLDGFKMDGRLYAIPYQYPKAFIPVINTKWLEKVNLSKPKNVNELANVARAFVRNKLGGDNTVALTHLQPNHLDSYLTLWGIGHGQVLYDENGKTYCGWLTPEALECLHWLQDMYAEGLFDKEYNSKTEQANRQFIMNNGVGFYWEFAELASQQNINAVKAGTGDKMYFESFFPPLTAKTGGKVVRFGHSYPFWAVGEASKNREAAFAFIEFMLTIPGAEMMGLVEGKDYRIVDGQKVRLIDSFNQVIDHYQGTTYIKNWTNALEYPKQDQENLESLRSFPLVTLSLDINQAIVGEYANDLLIQVLFGRMSPETFQSILRSQLQAANIKLAY
jgi:ABC-type glycerol-3-phosphate transport system substrate-binding protein